MNAKYIKASNDELQAEVEQQEGYVSKMLYALGVDPSDWIISESGVKSAIESNLKVARGEIKDREEWGDVPEGTITEAIFKLRDRMEQAESDRDVVRAANKALEADAAAMRAALEYFTSDEASFGWSKDHYTCLRCVGTGKTPETVEHRSDCEVWIGIKALETNAGADLLARLVKAESERDDLLIMLASAR